MTLTRKEKKLLADLVYAEHIRLMSGVVDVFHKQDLMRLWDKLQGCK